MDLKVPGNLIQLCNFQIFRPYISDELTKESARSTQASQNASSQCEGMLDERHQRDC